MGRRVLAAMAHAAMLLAVSGGCVHGVVVDADVGADTDADADVDADSDSDTCTGTVELCNGLDDDCDLDTDEDDVCPCERLRYDRSLYLFCTAPRTWDEARRSCDGFGWGLVGLGGEAENDFVGRAAWDRANSYWWIGLNDLDEEGSFRWAATGEVATFTSFADGEPNDAAPGEDCVSTDYASFGGWNDYPCSNELPYVCELQ